MATNSNSSQNTSDDNLPQKKFAFVEHESNKRELRSHAMREHWKNRRQTMNEEKQKKTEAHSAHAIADSDDAIDNV